MNKPTISSISIILILLFGLQSYAQNYVPFTPRFNDDLKGDIVLIGNNILGPGNDPFNENDVYNHNVNMIHIDIDGDTTTFNSSSADLTLPNPECYRIKHAGLYWSAVTNGDNPINTVKFKGPNGGYNDITGEIIYEANGTATGDSFPYACYADVTSIVETGDLGTYTVANVSSAEGETSTFDPYNGTGYSAGWSLFIVYQDPTMPGKSITSFDGFSAISSSVNTDVEVSGFRTVPAPAPVRANFAFATLEGDKPIQNDRMLLNGVPLSAVDRPANNFFNSAVTDLSATPVNNRVPNSTNTLGFDTGVMVVPNPGNGVIANDATSASVRLESNQDVYFQYFFALAVDIIEPSIVLTKTVEDDLGNDIGGQTVGLGAPLNYVIGFQNFGNDDTRNLRIRDILPINIIFNFPEDLVLPPGVSVSSYDVATRELIFEVDDFVVEENDPRLEIRIEAQVVETCNDLADACSNLINNQAFASYEGTLNPGFVITDDPSVNSNVGCLIAPQATNFLANLDDCIYSKKVVLCGSSVELTAANGYDSYSWSTSDTGTPVIGTTQTITVTETGIYYVFNTAIAPCQSIVEIFEVDLFGVDVPNPVIPFADEVVTCPNDGKLLPNIFLCGANDSRNILTELAGAESVIWEVLDETSCDAVTNTDCANEDNSCTWNQVATGSDYIADTAGQYRLTINYDGGCFLQFYFNVYQNVLSPTVTASDIICTTPGTITVNGVPNGYEYSLDNVNFQASNVFSVTTAGIYTVYIRQIGIPTNPCVFTVPDVQVRERDFTVTNIVTQPLCNGDKGNIQLAANDVEPQYFFKLYDGATLVTSVGPITENNYEFQNLNPGTYTAVVETEDGCTFSEEVIIIEPPVITVSAALTSPLTCEDGEITIYPVGGTPPYFYFINSTVDFQTVPEFIVTTPGVYDITVLDANNCSANTTITVDAIPEPDFTTDITNIACASSGSTGGITVNVTNANGNSLEYSIDGGTTFFNSPVFTGLAVGDYQVVVQYSIGDSVCTTDPQTVSITSDSPIEGIATLTALLTCTSNATITVSGVTGGVAPYSYSIDGVTFQNDPNFTNLSAGTYNITIKDASGCTVIVNSITIDPLNPPTDLDFSNTPVTCPSNTSTISITSTTGGTGVLEYQIIAPTSAATAYQTSTDFPGLEPGTYTFQVKDENDCTYSESFTIEPLIPVAVATILTKDLDCTATPDALISGLISGGTAPFIYAVSFNNAAYTSLGTTGTVFTYSASNAGTYQFQITDANGCIVESTQHTVLPITPPVLTLITQKQDILCNGDSNGALSIDYDPTIGTAPFTINVTNTTTGVDYGTQTSGLPAGDYTITLTDAKSCTASDTITISEPDLIDVDYSIEEISCDTGSQGEIIINGVSGGTAPYNYYVTGNGYSNSELNTTGSTPISFNSLNFGLYQIIVTDANGCSVLNQDVLIASPPTDLDITVDTTVDCLTGGEAVVSVGSSLTSTGPFFFSIYQGPISVYPNPPGSWIPEDAPGSQSATFTGLTPGVSYTFIVYDASTNCSYYEPETAPIPTNSSLTLNAVSANNITCTGSDDGNVSFTVNSIYGTATTISYEIFDSLSQISTGIAGTDTVPAGGSITVTDLGPLPFGNYYVVITETSGPNSGCGVVTAPFNITQSAIQLSLITSIEQNANCNANSGVISAIAQNGTAPYLFQITTTPAAPLATDVGWNSSNTFNQDAGNYYVHVLDAYGCIVTSPVVVLPGDPSPEVAAIVTNECTVDEGAYQIDVTLVTAGIPPYSYSIDGGAFQALTAPFTISNLSSGTHTVEVQDTNGCGNTVTVDITPSIGLTPVLSSAVSCNNDDGQITVNGSGGTGSYTYSISPSSGSIILTGNVFSGVPSGLYTITITDAVTGCTEVAEIVLPEATPPTLTTSPSSVITCFDDNTGAFEINVSGYSGPYTYEVFNTSGTSVTGSVTANTSTNPEIVSGMEAGTYSVVITETNSPFCTATSTVVISSPSEALAIDASETSSVTCADGEGTITAIASGGWGDYEYELTGDATVAYSTNNTFTNLSAGTYTVNARDSEGCIVSSTLTLNFPTPIAATFTPSSTLLDCFGDANASITVTTVTGGQGSNYTYTLNMLSPTTSTSGPQTSNIFENLAAGTYSITITDGFECEFTSVDITINEPDPIQASLVSQTPITCDNDATLTLSATGGTGPYAYSDDSSFSTILGTFADETTFFAPAGTYSFYVRDANGCIALVSNEITIEELEPLLLNLESENPIINCAGDNTGVIIAEAQGGLGNYVYTLQDTSGGTVTAVQDSPGVFTELLAGDYVVLVESGDCDYTSAIISITQPLAPLNVDFIVNNVSCPGFNNGSLEINATGGTGAIQYAISPQLNQFFDINVFENLMPGTYEVIVQDELGCYETFSFTLTEPDPVILSVVADSMFEETCAGEENGEFSIDISGGTPPYSVSLDDYNGDYITGATTQTQFDFTNLSGGDHIVYIRDSQGCESEWNITFPGSIDIQPILDITYNCDNNIPGNIVTVTVDDSTLDLADLDYSLNGGPYQMSNVFINVAAGTDQYITVRHTDGCEETTEFFDIIEFEPLTLTLTEGEINEIIANAEGGTGDYQFSLNGEDLGSNNSFVISETGEYTVIVTDSSGCTATASIVMVFIDLCLPDYFTPNGDGANDLWGPACALNYPDLDFDIFDRYGRKVATYDLGEYWDGKYNNSELPTGDYWYVVRLNSSEDNREFVGHFTLYR